MTLTRHFDAIKSIDARAAIDGSYRDQIAADDATIGDPVEPVQFRQAAE